MQTWHRGASTDFHCPPSCLPLPYFQSGPPLDRALLLSLCISGQESKGTESQVAASRLNGKPGRGAGRGRLPFLVPGAHWAWWVTGGIPKVWKEGLLLRSRRSLQPPGVPRVSGGVTGQEAELKESSSVM